MIIGICTRIIYDFLVIIQGSYMISLVSYKDRTKKSSMDSMKSYIILVWNQRNFNPGEDILQYTAAHADDILDFNCNCVSILQECNEDPIRHSSVRWLLGFE